MPFLTILWENIVLWCFQAQVKPLLPPVKSKDAGKICVVIDLDETLVHSSFKVGTVLSEVMLHHYIAMYWYQKCSKLHFSPQSAVGSN